MPKTYERLAAGGVVVGAALIAAVIALSLSAANENRQAERLIAHTRDVVESGLRAAAEYQDVALHSERYVVTREDSELRKVEQAQHMLDGELTQLRQLTRESIAHRQLVDELARIVRDGYGYNRRLRARRGLEGLRAALAERKATTLDQVREKTRQIVNAEQRMLVERQARHDRSARRTRMTFAAACLLALAGLGASLMLLLAGARRRVLSEAELRRRSEELARSNTELERFAYVASHDLKEPLRMIVSYTQLLERRYKGKLDAEADEFIHYAIDGARRMNELIDGLLEFSRAGRGAGPAGPVEADRCLDAALANLKAALQESGGRVERAPLPLVLGTPLELTRVFQNLVGNALKFRGERPPVVTVAAERRGDDWVFRVRDNGIGMAGADLDRIFGLFQRLHAKAKYPGTGLGLAICKKIVESRGGRIWVESRPGDGAAFFFTMKAAEPRMAIIAP